MSEPQIIQGGMGVGVSHWPLANAVAKNGQLGVVSSTGLDSLLLRRLQLGDDGGHIQRALSNFPIPSLAEKILKKYWIPGGKSPTARFAPTPILSAQLTPSHQALLVIANFTEVHLAKEGHSGPVGINLLEKIQIPILASLYGAMLAGVDYVIMGAGVPKDIPVILDRLSQHEDVQYKLHVTGAAPGDDFKTSFSPAEFFAEDLSSTADQRAPLRRPKFLAVVSSNVLAQSLAKRIARPVDGLIIERPTAGGHNAPPRGAPQLSEAGEPLYGQRDEVDFHAIAALGLPFWVAGSAGSADGLKAALAMGAVGVQVGTAFALCRESGLDPKIVSTLIQKVRQGEAQVFTDPRASPTGFPFKIAQVSGTLSEDSVYQSRQRRCDLGYLREIYKKPDGNLGYRCAGEPLEVYLIKGGQAKETQGRKCLCNGLTAAAGYAQRTFDGAAEKSLVTIGDDVNAVLQFVKDDDSYSASDVIETIRFGVRDNCLQAK